MQIGPIGGEGAGQGGEGGERHGEAAASWLMSSGSTPTGSDEDRGGGFEDAWKLWALKGGIQGACWICGEKGHRAADCQKGGGKQKGMTKGNSKGDYKGNFKHKGNSDKGKGKGKGGFHGECSICGQYGHSSRVCPKGKGE